MPTVWAFSVSLAATWEVALAFSSYGYLDVSVPHVRPVCLCIQHTVIRVSRDQRLFDSFPELFAAFHALHRLLAPRHPPHALMYLATLINSQNTYDSNAGLSSNVFARKRLQMPLRLHSIVKDQPLTSLAVRFVEGGVYQQPKSLSTPSVEEFFIFFFRLVPKTFIIRTLETIGIEPTTSALQGQRSPS